MEGIPVLYSTLVSYKNKYGSGGPDLAVLKYHPLRQQNKLLSDDLSSQTSGSGGGWGWVGVGGWSSRLKYPLRMLQAMYVSSL